MFTNTTQLRNNEIVTIRPLQAQDIAAIVAMHQRVSDESIYYRYLRFVRPGFEEIDRLYHLDADRGAAVVAVSNDRTVGVATYHITDKTPHSITAEPAFLVEDGFQGQGLGRALFQQLTRYALKRGIQAFNFYIHATNREMMHLIQGSGLPFEETINFDLREVRLRLEPEPVTLRQHLDAVLKSLIKNTDLKLLPNT